MKAVTMAVPEEEYPSLAHLYRPFSCLGCRHTFLAPVYNPPDRNWADKMIRHHEDTCWKRMSNVTQLFLDSVGSRMEYVS